MKRKTIKQVRREELLAIREEIILEIVDREMRPIIKDLRKAGLETFACCEGGPGHSFSRPTVRIQPKHSKRDIFTALKNNGYDGYEVSQVYDSTERPYFWQITFHTERPKRGVRLTYARWYLTDEATKIKFKLYQLLNAIENDTGIGDAE